MDVDIKEEPSIEIEGYMLIDATVGQNFGFSEDDQDSPRKKRKRSDKSENIGAYNATDEMQKLLRKWGLEVLCERFSKNLIDLNVLDYIVDVDIVDLCRDLPIRYRLILRHKLAEKRGKCVHNLDSNERKEKANSLRFTNAYEKSRGEPMLRHSDEHLPKRAKCPIDMVLNRPFATRSEEEKSLLISMEIPRPSMPALKSSRKMNAGKSTVTRKFSRTSYESAWWLCGSQKRNKLFCWPCLLFSQPTDPLNAVWSKKGFNDLNHISSSIKVHSTSQRHIDNINAYKHYGQPPATMDNEMQSGSGIENGVNNPKRSITMRKVSSNDNSKNANDKKMANKSPVANASATLEDDHSHIVNILNQDVKLQSSKPPSDRA
ncbi:uncharacterized protein LOC135712833 [Ochlerotatus camptorhynchus]|uniref:uncharacterized protein LOC135712833 n=1 Tax=Ochlerotatus camptorhynchus TaxID=644619 RepID=UPI0031E33240